MGNHAFLSASGAPAWTRCLAKVWLEKDEVKESSYAANEGTLAHRALERLIETKGDLVDIAAFLESHKCPSEMGGFVISAYEIIQKYAEGCDVLASEIPLDLENVTGEPGAKGTADVLIVKGTTATVVDLKYGMQKVEAAENEQLILYGLGALQYCKSIGAAVDKIVLVIVQPRLYSVSEWTLYVEDLIRRGQEFSLIAKRILTATAIAYGDDLIPIKDDLLRYDLAIPATPVLKNTELTTTPGGKQCGFCAVKNNCKSYRDYNMSVIVKDFTNLKDVQALKERIEIAKLQIRKKDNDQLSDLYASVDLIKDWCNTVQSEMFNRLARGIFDGKEYKLVHGREGNRKLSDDEADMGEINKLSQEFSLPVTEQKYLSVAELERRYKKVNPEFWGRISQYVTRSAAPLVIAPMNDKREAVSELLEFTPIDNKK